MTAESEDEQSKGSLTSCFQYRTAEFLLSHRVCEDSLKQEQCDQALDALLKTLCDPVTSSVALQALTSSDTAETGGAARCLQYGAEPKKRPLLQALVLNFVKHGVEALTEQRQSRQHSEGRTAVILGGDPCLLTF